MKKKRMVEREVMSMDVSALPVEKVSCTSCSPTIEVGVFQPDNPRKCKRREDCQRRGEYQRRGWPLTIGQAEVDR